MCDPMSIFKSRNRARTGGIDPHEIFLDSVNLPEFNAQQFEGRLEKPIAKKTGLVVGLFSNSMPVLSPKPKSREYFSIFLIHH